LDLGENCQDISRSVVDFDFSRGLQVGVNILEEEFDDVRVQVGVGNSLGQPDGHERTNKFASRMTPS